MPRRDPRVDKYIDKAPAYAKPILKKLRDILLGADKTVQEDIKWGAPTLMKDGIVCSYMGFRKHVALWFHKGTLLEDPARLLNGGSTIAMRAAHFTKESQVKAKPITAMLKQAVKLNVSGIKTPKRAAVKKAVVVPKELSQALSKSTGAKKFFDSLPPSERRGYADWIRGAKTAATKQRRIKQAIDKLLRGERRDEKYKRPRKSAAARGRPSARKATRKPAKSTAKKTAKSTAKKKARKFAMNAAKRTAKKSARKPAKKSPKKTARKPAKSAAKKSPKKTARKPAKSAAKKSPKKTARKPAKSAAKKSPKKTARKPAKSAAKKSPKKTARKPAKSAAKKAARRPTKKGAKKAARKVAKPPARKPVKGASTTRSKAIGRARRAGSKGAPKKGR